MTEDDDRPICPKCRQRARHYSLKEPRMPNTSLWLLHASREVCESCLPKARLHLVKSKTYIEIVELTSKMDALRTDHINGRISSIECVQIDTQCNLSKVEESMRLYRELDAWIDR